MKKRRRQAIALGVVATMVVSMAIGYGYYLEQVRIKGLAFGNQLQQIQENLKAAQESFESQRIILEEGDISRQDFIEYTNRHVMELEAISLQYDSLDIPGPFVPSVELFRLSTVSQTDSVRELLLWLETGDISHQIRSDELFQESFEYELAALSHFNAAKRGATPQPVP